VGAVRVGRRDRWDRWRRAVARPGWFAAKHLAESWAAAAASAAGGPTALTALAAFQAEDAINFALLSPLNLVFAGFTFMLYGLATAVSQAYPRWLGWMAVAGGRWRCCGAVSGVVQAYLGEPSGLTKALGITAPTIITLWLLIMGILLLRRGADQADPLR
jgi:hypothetical protein